MTAIQGTYKNGQIVIDAPADWPDGCRVRIEPLAAFDDEDDGGTGDPQRNDPESIARWLAAFDDIPPMEMTAEEEAEWVAARQAQKDFEKATFEERAKRLERMFS